MTVEINSKVSFIDSSDIEFTRVSKDFATKQEASQIQNKENVLIDNTFRVNIRPGLDSKSLKNNILNSSAYENNKKSYYYAPFSEHKSESGVIQTQMNPTVFVRTYGLCNSEDESGVTSYNESVNVYDTSNYFKDSETDTISFPYTFNSSQLNCLSSILSPFNIIDELNATALTTLPLTGIKSKVISNGIDSRDRSINVDTKTKLDYDYSSSKYKVFSNNENTTEPFCDQEYEDLVTGRKTLIENNYAVVTSSVNNQTVISLDTTLTSKSSIFTNKVLFYTLDDVHIIPYKEKEAVITNKVNNTSTEAHVNDVVYDDSFVYQSYGHDLDKSLNSQVDSFAFLGELD